MHMEYVPLGRTGLTVSRPAFGCLPIQRIAPAEAAALICRALDAGITFYDTARAYTDSEAKLGPVLSPRRADVVIATKTAAEDADGLRRDLADSLAALQTDYIDLYQFHNPGFVPKPGGADGLYDAALDAQRQGLIRHIGITQHSVALAEEAIESGLYATLQYPFNHLATDRELALMRRCGQLNVGFIAMKALSGGLITDAAVSWAYIHQFPGPVPIWGFQRMAELENILALSDDPPTLDQAMQGRIDQDRVSLAGAFCRGCGYCQPCPANIPIENANRMTQMITRSPSGPWMTPAWREGMARVEDCTHCGLCHTRCPYGLKPYETLPDHLAFYREYIANHGG